MDDPALSLEIELAAFVATLLALAAIVALGAIRCDLRGYLDQLTPDAADLDRQFSDLPHYPEQPEAPP